MMKQNWVEFDNGSLLILDQVLMVNPSIDIDSYGGPKFKIFFLSGFQLWLKENTDITRDRFITAWKEFNTQEDRSENVIQS